MAKDGILIAMACANSRHRTAHKQRTILPLATIVWILSTTTTPPILATALTRRLGILKRIGAMIALRVVKFV